MTLNQVTSHDRLDAASPACCLTKEQQLLRMITEGDINTDPEYTLAVRKVSRTFYELVPIKHPTAGVLQGEEREEKESEEEESEGE